MIPCLRPCAAALALVLVGCGPAADADGDAEPASTRAARDASPSAERSPTLVRIGRMERGAIRSAVDVSTD
ncbi:MAG: hypothetical protein ACF8XB_14160, partial [Planctomycetota bacterium JB042]